MHSHRSVGWIVLVLLIVSITGVAIGGGAAQTSDEAHFEVEIDGASESIAEGDTLVVEATITNIGDVEDSQQIHLKNFDNEIVDSIAGPPVTLEPGESETVTLRWETERGDAGTGEFKVASNDEYPVESLEIREGEFFDVSIDEPDSSIEAGENLTVDVNVTNTGNVTGTPRVWFALDDTVEDERELELEPGETERVTFTWESDESHAGEWTLTAGVDDERKATSTVVVEGDGDGAAEDDEDDTTYSGGGGSDLVAERSNSLIEGSVANVSGHDVERVEFATNVDGRITVDELRGLPDDADPVNDTVAIYRVEVPEEAYETPGTIQLTVDSGTLHGADAERVVVKHWNGGNWTELPTEATANDGDVTITAETQGFSLFAVTIDEKADTGATEGTDAATETSTEVSTEASTDTPSSTATATESDGATATEASQSTPEPESTESNEETPGFGAGVALLALIVSGTLGTLRRRRD